MKKTIRQSISNYHMPMYMCEILVNNYCPSFLSMSIVKEDDSYMFSYETGYSKKLEWRELELLDKLIMLRSIVKLNGIGEDWLIGADTYLLEPDLIYSYNNSVYTDEMKLLFYPDFEKMPFSEKMPAFIEKIKDKRNRRECEILDKLKQLAKENDFVQFDRILEKSISRLREEKQLKTN